MMRAIGLVIGVMFAVMAIWLFFAFGRRIILTAIQALRGQSSPDEESKHHQSGTENPDDKRIS